LLDSLLQEIQILTIRDIPRRMTKITLSIDDKAKADELSGLDLGDCLPPPPPPSQNNTKEHLQLSPTPKNPLNKSKSGLCRRLLLFIIGIFVLLVLLRTAACLVDYTQDSTTTNMYYREVGDFPKEVGKYVVAVLYETPRDLQRMFDSVVNTVKNIKRTSEDHPSMKKTWESIKEGSFSKINTVKEIEVAEDHLFDSTSNDQEEGAGQDLTVVEDVLSGTADFFSNLLKDVSSVFQDSENKPGDESVMVETNAIPRHSHKHQKEETVADMTEHGMLESDVQADKPQAAEHTTENNDDGVKDVLDVMEEVWLEPTESRRNKDKFLNLIMKEEDSHNH